MKTSITDIDTAMMVRDRLQRDDRGARYEIEWVNHTWYFIKVSTRAVRSDAVSDNEFIGYI
jgi:hypothetical protein